MIFTLILILAVVIFLAFFVGKNLSNLCTLWIFKTFTNLPVAMLVLISFGAGIIFSILFMMIYKLRRPSVSSDVVSEVQEQLRKEEIKKQKMDKKAKKLQEKQLRNKKSEKTAKNDDKTIVQEIKPE